MEGETMDLLAPRHTVLGVIEYILERTQTQEGTGEDVSQGGIDRTDR